MKIAFDLNVILYFAAIIIGLFSAVLLIASLKNKLPNLLLALLLIAITGWIIDAFFRASGIYGQNPNLYFLPIYYSFSFGPLIYLYVQAITNNRFSLSRKHLWHFLPVLVQAAFYWIVSFQNYETKYHLWFAIHQPYTYRIEYDGTWLSLMIYLLLSIRYMSSYRHWLQDNYSNLSKKMLNWLWLSLFILVLVCASWLFEAYLRDFSNIYYQYDVSTNLLCAVIYSMGIISYQQVGVELSFSPENTKQEEIKPLVVVDDGVMEKILSAMEKDKLYLNAELTLADVARHINVPAKQVSANINAAFNKPFNSFINTYRIEEIKLRLKSDDLKKLTLLGIAYESGFNSKTSFNRIFKEATGLSPSDYLKR